MVPQFHRSTTYVTNEPENAVCGLQRISDPEDRPRRVDAIKRLIEMLNAREAIGIHVMLLQYYIEGEPCPASALTVSPDLFGSLSPNSPPNA
jgi:hypothetical protein